MCLWQVISTYTPALYPKGIEAWKLFETTSDKNVLRPLFNKKTVPFNYRFNKWYKAKGSLISVECPSLRYSSYRAGFHCFQNFEDARKFKEANLWFSLSSAVILKVRLRNVHTVGEEMIEDESNRMITILVGEEMLIPSPKGESTLCA